MANATNYWGLRPVKHQGGAPWNGVTEKCFVGSDDPTALYIGQPVQISTDSSASDATAKYTSVLACDVIDADIIYGVITSVDDSEDYSTVYRATRCCGTRVGALIIVLDLLLLQSPLTS